MRRKEEAEMRAKQEEEAQKQLLESHWVVPGREHYLYVWMRLSFLHDILINVIFLHSFSSISI